jgi:nodulation protein E
MKRVVITGMGVVSSGGYGVEAAWRAAHLGEPQYRAEVFGTFRKPLARVPANGRADAVFQPVKDLDPTVAYARDACEEAVRQAGLRESVHAHRLGCILGSGAGNQQTHEEVARRLYGEGKTRLHPLTIPRGMFGAVTSVLAAEYGAKGVAYSVSSACASSTHALGLAMLSIRTGAADVMISGGSEACLTRGCLAAWDALHVLAAERCRPFSAGRDGLVLAEGAAVFVLEEREHARSRGAAILAELVGYGACSDATALTSPDPEGMANAMRLAIEDAGLQPANVSAINAHGTATELNDRSECMAISGVFGVKGGNIPVTSTKSVLGHSLGASGGIELAMSVRSLQEQFVPPTANHIGEDPACPVDCVPNQGRRATLESILSNSFAFGGLNASLVVRHADAA